MAQRELGEVVTDSGVFLNCLSVGSDAQHAKPLKHWRPSRYESVLTDLLGSPAECSVSDALLERVRSANGRTRPWILVSRTLAPWRPCHSPAPIRHGLPGGGPKVCRPGQEGGGAADGGRRGGAHSLAKVLSAQWRLAAYSGRTCWAIRLAPRPRPRPWP